MKQRAVEKFYSVAETAFLLGFGPSWVRMKFCDATAPYAEGVVKDGKDFRIPASAINRWWDDHRLRRPAAEDLGIAARSPTELKRKLRSIERAEREEAAQ